MNKIDKQLTGSNFCGLDCIDKQNIIHPETCVDNIVVSNESTKTLNDWLSNYSTEEPPSAYMSFTTTTGLLDWLQHNYPIDLSGVPIATRNTVGAVKIDDTYLDIDTTTGLLGINLTAIEEGLNIPTISNASFDSNGVIKLGNSTAMTSNFSDSTIIGQLSKPYSYNGEVYMLPLRSDANNRTGIAIPTNLFNTSTEIILPNWTLDWSKNTTNVSTSPISGGVTTNYILLGNKNINTANGELGYDIDGNLSTDNGYPRFALVAGSGITFTRYNNTFLPSNDWGSNITEVEVSCNPIEDWQTVTSNQLTDNNVIENNKKYIFNLIADKATANTFYIQNPQGTEVTVIINNSNRYSINPKLYFYINGTTQPTGFLTTIICTTLINDSTTTTDIQYNNPIVEYTLGDSTLDNITFDFIMINIRQGIAYIYVKCSQSNN